MNPDASISDKDDDDKMFEFGLFLSPTLALFRLENSPLQISSYGYLNQVLWWDKYSVAHDKRPRN